MSSACYALVEMKEGTGPNIQYTELKRHKEAKNSQNDSKQLKCSEKVKPNKSIVMAEVISLTISPFSHSITTGTLSASRCCLTGL